MIDLSDPNLRWVLGATALLGVAAAVLGCFALLRGRALIGDTLAHASLPGVCAAFWFVEVGRAAGWWSLDPRNLVALFLGAGAAGILAAGTIQVLTRHSRIKDDTAQAIGLSFFFGLGIVFLTQLQRGESGYQSGLDKYLFGQAASMVQSDVWALGAMCLALCLLAALLWKEFKLLCFDRSFGAGIGLPMPMLDVLLMALLTGAVVAGLQAVGVVLIAALLIVPPAAARFWTDDLGKMILIAATFGALSGAGGSLLSTIAPRMPTGPLIVLFAVALFIISMLFAPLRGVVAASLRRRAPLEAIS